MKAFNPKYVVMFAMCLYIVTYVGYGASPTIAGVLGVEVITMLKVFRLVQGVANAFGNACCMAVVADVLPKELFATGMGFYGWATIGAQAFGPSIGVMARDAVGYEVTYFVAGGIMVVAILLATQIQVMPREKKKFALDPKSMIAKEALMPTLINFLLATGYTAVNAFLLVYAEERGVAGASLFFTVYAFAQLATRPTVGKLVDKYGFVKISVPCAVINIISLVMIAYSTNVVGLLIAGALCSAGYGGIQPAIQALCIRSVEPERRGAASSTNFIGLDVATLVAPTVVGYIANSTGYVPVMWIAMSVFIIVGILIIIVCRKRIGKIEDDFLARTAASEEPAKA